MNAKISREFKNTFPSLISGLPYEPIGDIVIDSDDTSLFSILDWTSDT